MRGFTLTFLLAAACARATPQPSVLEVATIPVAEVLIDGKSAGSTPVRHELAAGSHKLVIRAEAFKNHEQTLDIVAEQTRKVEVTLVPTDPQDAVAIRLLGQAFDLEFVDLEEAVRMRGRADDDWIMPTFPRGSLLIGDLGEFRLDAGAEFKGEGAIEFRRGTRILHSIPFAPGTPLLSGDIPTEVMNSVTSKAGTISWGFYPKKGKPVTAKFKVVKRDSRLQRRLDSLDKRLDGQPPAVARQLRAQLYLNKKYYLSAYQEARKVFEEDPQAAQAIAIMQSSLRRMKLTEGPLWSEVQRANANLPGKKRVRARTQSK